MEQIKKEKELETYVNTPVTWVIIKPLFFYFFKVKFKNFRSYMSKIISGLPIKLNSRMILIFTNYEANVLKQKMMSKRKLEEL
jgi:hypothetical protein